MSAQESVGRIISSAEYRDAIHIALCPVASDEKLSPGQAIALVGDRKVSASGYHIGIVDPFLRAEVAPGQWFYMFLYPNTITSLRHEWTHPAFGEDPVKGLSEQWIRKFADSIPLAYEVLMSGAAGWVESKKHGGYGEYLCFGGLLEGEYVPDEFWPHYENVTGTKVADEHRGSFFTCSC